MRKRAVRTAVAPRRSHGCGCVFSALGRIEHPAVRRPGVAGHESPGRLSAAGFSKQLEVTAMAHAVVLIVAMVIAVVLWSTSLIVAEGCVRLYRRLKAPTVVRCPRANAPAAVQVQPQARTAFSLAPHQLHVWRCSHWPAQAPCDQACLKQIPGMARP